MDKFRKATALLSALLVAAAVSSCGQNSEESYDSDEPVGITSEAETSERDNSAADDDEISGKDDEDTSSTGNSSSKSESSPESSKANASSSSSSSLGGSSSASGNNSSGGSSASSSGSTSSSGGASAGSSSNNNPSSNNTSSGGSSTNSNSSGSAKPDEESVAYTAEITLGSVTKYTGGNVSVNGSVTSITGGGEYHISGTVSDGQIVVNTTEKVKLHLDGVNITCSTGPAIMVEDAKRLTIRLMEGTTNTLVDGGSDKINDGVIFSNDTVEIRGKGTLNITAGNAHGIASDDDVVIENGNINITSIKSGIHTNDDITINGGNLTINGGTNGMKSKGTVHINGGYSVISGGTKEEKSSIYSAGAFEYTGGYLFAAGNKVTAPTSSATPYVVAGFTGSQAAGTGVSLSINGAEAVNFTPHSTYKCIMMLSPELTAGSKFSAKIGGINYGDYTISADSSKNIITLE